MTVAERVGKPFPFPSGRWLRAPEDDGPASNPALADDHLQKRPLVILIHWPFAEPYVGARAAPDASTLARGLAEHLRDTGVTVVDVRIQPGQTNAPPAGEQLPNTGDLNGQALNSAGAGGRIDQSPTVFVVGSDEIVRAVFEGRDAWDALAVERAARQLISAPASTRSEGGLR